MMWAVGWIVDAGAASSCAHVPTEVELITQARHAESVAVDQALGTGGAEPVDDAVRALIAAIGCASTAIPTEVVVALHVAEGLRLVGRGELQEAKGAFLAARLAEPEAACPSLLVEAAHFACTSLFHAIPVDRTDWEPLPERGGISSVTVRPDALPTRLPVVVQRQTRASFEARYLWPPEPLPRSWVAPRPAPWVLVGTGAGMVLAGVITAATSPLRDPDDLNLSLSSRWQSAQLGAGLTLVAVGVGGVAGGLAWRATERPAP